MCSLMFTRNLRQVFLIPPPKKKKYNKIKSPYILKGDNIGNVESISVFVEMLSTKTLLSLARTGLPAKEICHVHFDRWAGHFGGSPLLA